MVISEECIPTILKRTSQTYVRKPLKEMNPNKDKNEPDTEVCHQLPLLCGACHQGAGGGYIPAQYIYIHTFILGYICSRSSLREGIVRTYHPSISQVWLLGLPAKTNTFPISISLSSSNNMLVQSNSMTKNMNRVSFLVLSTL